MRLCATAPTPRAPGVFMEMEMARGWRWPAKTSQGTPVAPTIAATSFLVGMEGEGRSTLETLNS